MFEIDVFDSVLYLSLIIFNLWLQVQFVVEIGLARSVCVLKRSRNYDLFVVFSVFSVNPPFRLVWLMFWFCFNFMTSCFKKYCQHELVCSKVFELHIEAALVYLEVHIRNQEITPNFNALYGAVEDTESFHTFKIYKSMAKLSHVWIRSSLSVFK